jgi:hypothetical protein
MVSYAFGILVMLLSGYVMSELRIQALRSSSSSSESTGPYTYTSADGTVTHIQRTQRGTVMCTMMPDGTIAYILKPVPTEATADATPHKEDAAARGGADKKKAAQE